MIKIIQDSPLSYNKIQQQPIEQVRGAKSHKFDDFLAVEMPVEIRLGHDQNQFETLAVTLCSPAEIDDFIYGHLFTASLISDVDEVLSIEVHDQSFGLIVEVVLKTTVDYLSHLQHRSTVTHASCGVCGKTSFEQMLTNTYPKINKIGVIKPEVIGALPSKINDQQMAT